MLLSDLDPDVLLHIFCLTDVYTILTLSRTNKYFYEITSTRPLWISVIRVLSSRRLVDPPLDTNWETLSTQALKDEVKRAILGPSTWSVASPAPPTVYRSITVSLDDVRANGDLSPILLPGGRHIFVHIVEQGVRGVECRDVFSGRRLWSWVCPGRNVLYSTVDFAGRDYKATVGIVSEDGNHHFYIVIVEVDLSTCDSSELFLLPMDFFSPWHLTISGDVFACARGDRDGNMWQGDGNRSILVLVNWRTGEFIIFDSFRSKYKPFLLLPGYIILAKSNYQSRYPTVDHLCLFSIFSLHPLWRPLHLWSEYSEFDLINRADTTGIVSVLFDLPSDHLHEKPFVNLVELLIAESALHENTYEIVVDGRGVIVDPPKNPPSAPTSFLGRILNRTPPSNPQPPLPKYISTLARYHLVLPSAGTEPQVALRSVIRHTGLSGSPSGTRSRIHFQPQHTLVAYQLSEAGIGHRCNISSPSTLSAQRVQASDSGAVIVQHESAITISYYL